MDLKGYFAKADGTGVPAAAEADGKVDAAIYAKPVVIDNDSIALVMRQRLSHQQAA